MKIETTILKNLLQNEDYTRKVLPFLEENYFTDNNEKIIYNHINEFVSNYSSLPSKEALAIELSITFTRAHVFMFDFLQISRAAYVSAVSPD